MMDTLKTNEEEAVRMLGNAGVMVSVAFGQCGKFGLSWSVTCMRTATNEEFDRPFIAHSFLQAIAIAVIECRKRGWA
jgi:hypothetical protein